jgi:hypothetical protein
LQTVEPFVIVLLKDVLLIFQVLVGEAGKAVTSLILFLYSNGTQNSDSTARLWGMSEVTAGLSYGSVYQLCMMLRMILELRTKLFAEILSPIENKHK